MENKKIHWYHRPSVLITIWLLAGAITGLKQYLLSDVHSHINNFVIFKSSTGHFFNQMPFYRFDHIKQNQTGASDGRQTQQVVGKHIDQKVGKQ
jgi:hypothetical protein